MEVGIGLPSTIPEVGRDQVLDWARRAEARGFSTLGTIDRVVYANQEPLITLAAASAVTERIRLATAILNCTLEELADGTARLRAAWKAAGREGSPRTLVQPYFALGEGAEQSVERCLRDYYGSEEGTDAIVARAATDAGAVRENVRAFAEAGCDELIFFPCDPDPGQVDLLADASR